MSPRSPEPQRQRSAAWCALKIALIYTVFGGLWIAFSDWLLLRLIGDGEDEATLAWLETWKGWLFIAVTAVLLYLLVRRGVRTLERYAKSLEEARRSADAANRAKDRFLAILSHELRTPMTPVFATVSALAEDPSLDEAIRGDLQIVRRNVELQRQLVDDLLDMSRILSGKLSLHPQEVDVHDVLAQAARSCQHGVQAKGLTLQLRLDAERHHVSADGGRLLQVFANLLSNAIKFTPRGGRIDVRSMNRPGEGSAQPWLVVEVSDTGIGIKPELLPRIFEAYQQGEVATTQRFGGLGLGLAISRKIIEQHRGRLTASSAGCGQGATFTVELATVEPGKPSPKPSPAPASYRTFDILLVEDNPDTLRVLTKLLDPHAYRVHPANGFRAAVEAARRQPFDVLVADIGLPDGDGLELLRTIGQFRPMPGIAMSGYGMEADIERSRRAGYAEHVTKPINIHQLEEAIARVAGAGQADRPNVPAAKCPDRQMD